MTQVASTDKPTHAHTQTQAKKKIEHKQRQHRPLAFGGRGQKPNQNELQEEDGNHQDSPMRFPGGRHESSIRSIRNGDNLSGASLSPIFASPNLDSPTLGARLEHP